MRICEAGVHFEGIQVGVGPNHAVWSGTEKYEHDLKHENNIALLTHSHTIVWGPTLFCLQKNKKADFQLRLLSAFWGVKDLNSRYVIQCNSRFDKYK